MTTTTALLVNIPLMVLAFALMTGIPLWLVFKHPDRKPREARTVPQYQPAYAVRHAQAGLPQAADAQEARRPWTASV
jgi:hypothetical protein